ncbi:MAG: DUF2637 domain-containing protein [Streptosporangiaceae bacterium]
MSDFSAMRTSRPGDPHPTLRLAALTAVIIGVILVAVAAFLLSYEGIHQIALQAGVSAGLARLYPLMFDAMLVIACAATLALRSAGWGAKCYVWASLLLLIGAVAVGDALHATGVKLTGEAARATIAIIPWALLLMGFGLWLVMLRQWRRTRAMAADGTGGGRAALASAGSAAGAGGAVTREAGLGAAPTRTGAPRAGIDTLVERPAGQAPGRSPAAESPAAESRVIPGDAAGPQRRISPPEKHAPAAAGAAGAAGAGAGATPAGDPVAGTETEVARARSAGTETEVARARSAGPETEVARARSAGPGRSTAARAAQDRGSTSATKPQRGGTGGTSAGSRGDSANANRARNGTGSGDRRDIPAGAGDDEEGYVRLLPPQPKAPAGGAAGGGGAPAGEATPTDRARPGDQGTGAATGQDSSATPGQDSSATPRRDSKATPGQDNNAAPGQDNKTPGQDSKESNAKAGAGTGDHAEPSQTVLAPAPLPDFPRMRSTPTPPRDKEANGE